VGLRDYRNDWPWGPVTTAAEPTITNSYQTSNMQFPQPIIVRFNHWTQHDIV